MTNSIATQPPTQAALVMPFGKHRGQPLSQLPDVYLLWLACLDNLRQPLLNHVLTEMDRRLNKKEIRQDDPHTDKQSAALGEQI